MTDKHDDKIIDYFVISGLDVQHGLEPNQFAGDNLHRAPLDRSYAAHILAHYPKSIQGHEFDCNAISTMCHPCGVLLATQVDKRKTSLHSFVVTHEDRSMIFGVAITFYEEITNAEICGAMHTLHAMHMAELSNIQSKTLHPHLGERVYKISPKMPRKVIPDSQIRSYSITDDTLYATKVLCLLSRLPLIDVMQKTLSALYRIVIGLDSIDMGLESYISNFLYDVPCPLPGSSVSFKCGTQEIVCQIPSYDELPLLDYPIVEIFRLLGIEEVLNIYTCILLQYQILLYSEEYEYLMSVSECLTALTYPFIWPFSYAPILPTSNRNYIEAPVPFIMGIRRSKGDPLVDEEALQANMCIVDIDKALVTLPEDLPELPNRAQLREDLVKHLTEIQEQSSVVNRLQDRENLLTDKLNDMENTKNFEQVNNLSGKLQELQKTNSAFMQMTEIAKRAGVLDSIEKISDSLSKMKPQSDQNNTFPSSKSFHNLPTDDTSLMYSTDLQIERYIDNTVIRHVFLHYMLVIMKHFDSFFDLQEAKFDKHAFLADHPSDQIPFLAAFFESQMFVDFIDAKINCNENFNDKLIRNVISFTKKLNDFQKLCGNDAVLRFIKNEQFNKIIEDIRNRIINVTIKTKNPVALSCKKNEHTKGTLTNLDEFLLKKEATPEKKKFKSKAHKKRMENLLNPKTKKESFSTDTPQLLSFQDPKEMRHTNWKFVEALLKECKTKTKKMLVIKLDHNEACELGHGDSSYVAGVEENTLVSSLCDLLERIWAHGVNGKSNSRSALWAHLMAFKKRNEGKLTICRERELFRKGSLTGDFRSASLPRHGTTGNRSRPRRGSIEELNTLSKSSLLEDITNIHQLADLRTGIGYARAFVRLSIEKKLLAQHLRSLIEDQDLLRHRYKRYALLRSEEEREQLLNYLISLDAVDYTCFTSTFASLTMSYRVVVCPRAAKITGSFSLPTQVYITVFGTLSESCELLVPDDLDFKTNQRNLGAITTVRISQRDLNAKWFLDQVIVKNELTGHCYRLPCGRWIGKDVDDGAMERVLIAESFTGNTDNDQWSKYQTPPRFRSPSLTRRDGKKNQLKELYVQGVLADAVNKIVKYDHHKPNDMISQQLALTQMLCGENGLIPALELVFLFNFKSPRLFGKKLFIWDYLEKVAIYFFKLLKDDYVNELNETTRLALQSFTSTVARIQRSPFNVGKDGKFTIFILLGLQSHVIQKWLFAASQTPPTVNMYEEHSFLRTPTLLTAVAKLLDSLNSVAFIVEPSLLQGV